MSSVEKRFYIHHPYQLGPSHLFQDVDTKEIRAWYGQDPYTLPEGPGVVIHCILPEHRLDVSFFDYPSRPWISYHHDSHGACYYVSPTGQQFW